MRPPQVLREGTKKTVFVNFMDLCKTYALFFRLNYFCVENRVIVYFGLSVWDYILNLLVCWKKKMEFLSGFFSFCFFTLLQFIFHHSKNVSHTNFSHKNWYIQFSMSFSYLLLNQNLRLMFTIVFRCSLFAPCDINWCFIVIGFPFFLRMHRQPEHVMTFLLAEMGTSGSLDGQQRLVVKGRFAPKNFEGILRRYISKFLRYFFTVFWQRIGLYNIRFLLEI